MSITRRQAADLLLENYGDWYWDDPEWWDDMVEMLTTNYRSVKHLRKEDTQPGWHVPRWWPGAVHNEPIK